MKKHTNLFKILVGVISTFLLTSMSSVGYVDTSKSIIGVWESEEKNLQIEMFDEDGEFGGRMIYFQCSSEDIMRNLKDTENPDEALVHRKLLGLKLVSQLSYKGKGVWDDWKIYDPNSGNTYEARIQLTGPNTAVVRGYWKYRWIGRSMVFNRTTS